MEIKRKLTIKRNRFILKLITFFKNIVKVEKICNYVYQELLQGSLNDKEFNLLKNYLDSLPFYDLRYGKESFENAALIYMNCRKKGITVKSTVDLLIAEITIENDLFLFHNDSDYTNIAKINKNLKIY